MYGQDPAYGAADRVANRSSGAQVWRRLLHNGDTAVLLYNSHSLRAVTVQASFAELSILPSHPRMRVRDIWGRSDLGVAVGNISAVIQPRDVRWYRLSPVAPPVAEAGGADAEPAAQEQQPSGQQQPFLAATSIQLRPDLTKQPIWDFSFTNTDLQTDVDLVSIHEDSAWGVPWQHFLSLNGSGTVVPPPATWSEHIATVQRALTDGARHAPPEPTPLILPAAPG